MTSPSEAVDTIEKALEGRPYEGPWHVEEFTIDSRPHGWIMTESTIIAEIAGYLDSCGNGATAAYIAACSPDRMREVLALARKAEAMERALEFVARWAWREDPPNANHKLTDEERLSAIKWHPSVHALIGGDNAQG